MATQVSPGIVITETDKSLTLAQVALTDGGFAGPFRWGPAEQLVTVVSEQELVQRFFTPNNNTAEYFFTAANFLGYSRSLRLVRAIPHDANGDSVAYNASVDGFTDDVILNDEDYEKKSDIDLADFGTWVAKYPGALGNGLRVEVCDSANAYSQSPTQKIIALSGANTFFTENTTPFNTMQVGDIITVGGAKRVVTAIATGNTMFHVNTAFTNSVTNATPLAAFTINASSSNAEAQVYGGDISAAGLVANGDILVLVNGSNTHIANVTSVNSSVITFASAPSFTNNSTSLLAPVSFSRQWKYSRLFDSAPGTSEYAKGLGKANAHDEMHIVVIDTLGSFGPPNTVLERFAYVSKARDGKTNNNLSNYYREVINQTSPYIWWADHIGSTVTSNTQIGWGDSLSESETVDATANANIVFASSQLVVGETLDGGSDGPVVAAGDILRAYDLFKREDAEISFLLGGPVNASIATTLISDVIEPKKYVMGFFSPEREHVVNNVGNEVDDIIIYRNSLPSTSYAVLDSGWKYQYDKYNGVFRWVPLNGDVAGCLVRTDGQAESWFSPAGFTRGQIKNVVKLAFNPNQTQRDDLYRNGINPVVTFPGQGTVLFGDKTLLARPSAFDRINVRRLFVVLEKTIEQSAKQQLFEQNDEFTRNAFVNLVEPFLRSVRGRRGITDFYVVCDETNNPQDAIDRNEFRADIFIKPTRSINFIQLNFTAVRSDVAFSEVVTNLG